MPTFRNPIAVSAILLTVVLMACSSDTNDKNTPVVINDNGSSAPNNDPLNGLNIADTAIGSESNPSSSNPTSSGTETNTANPNTAPSSADTGSSSSDSDPSNTDTDSSNTSSDSSNSDAASSGSNTDIDEGAGSCLGLPFATAGDKALYSVSGDARVDSEILIEVTSVGSDLIKYIVSENGATYEAYLISDCFGTVDKGLIDDPNNNINGYSGNVALQQILEQNLYASHADRAFEDFEVVEFNCGIFSSYDKIDDLVVPVESCESQYSSQSFEGGSLFVNTSFSAFDIVRYIWIVEQNHTLASGKIELSIQLLDIRVAGVTRIVDSF